MWGLIFSLLFGQEPQAIAPGSVFLAFTVKDPGGRSIAGLKPEDLRLTEDGIPQSIAALREGGDPPSRAEIEASTEPRFLLKVREDDEQIAYVIRYSPDASNRNPAYRELKLQVLRAGSVRWTVRHAQGYFHDSPDA